jgi:hypothetical protein
MSRGHGMTVVTRRGDGYIEGLQEGNNRIFFWKGKG